MRAPADRSHDVIIVGARVAGAATALLLAQAGLKVLVIDRQPRGTDTLSTHALMRGGVQLLSRWGLLARLLEAGTPLIATTTFHYGDERGVGDAAGELNEGGSLSMQPPGLFP